MPRAPVLLPLLGLLAACDQVPREDRSVDPCLEPPASLRVEVVDSRGVPVPGATVTALHLESGRSLTATTGEHGTTSAVHAGLGTGRVRLQATAGSRLSPTEEVLWQCEGCVCLPTPPSLTLRLGP